MTMLEQLNLPPDTPVEKAIIAAEKRYCNEMGAYCQGCRAGDLCGNGIGSTLAVTAAMSRECEGRRVWEAMSPTCNDYERQAEVCLRNLWPERVPCAYDTCPLLKEAPYAK